MHWPLLFLFGVSVGILSGLLGIGGGVVLVPGMILLFGFSQAEAQGTSLAVMIPPIGIFAALVYYRNGDVHLPVVGLIAGGFMLGAFLGALLVPQLPVAYLRVAFGVLLLYLGFGFVFSPGGKTMQAALPAAIATAFTSLMAWLLRRPRKLAQPPPPPSDQHNYHI